MLQALRARLRPTDLQSIANEFSRLGWIGFWTQVALVTLPILLLIYVVLFSTPAGSEIAQRKGIDLGEYLSYGSLLVLLFTTFWFYRYTRLATRMANPKSRPAESTVMRTLWIGLVAGCLGILFSLLVMLGSVGRLLFALMATPQGGVPVIKTLGDGSATWVSVFDAVGLMALLFTLAAEFIVLTFSLWLLFRTTQASPKTAAST